MNNLLVLRSNVSQKKEVSFDVLRFNFVIRKAAQEFMYVDHKHEFEKNKRLRHLWQQIKEKCLHTFQSIRNVDGDVFLIRANCDRGEVFQRHKRYYFKFKNVHFYRKQKTNLWNIFRFVIVL